VRPSGRKCCQRSNVAFMALKKHLSDSRGSAEVSVDLERRMCIPEIVHDLCLQKLLKLLITYITVSDPCPGTQPVGNGPSGRTQSALLKGDLCRIQPCRCIAADRCPRIKAHQLGNMTVLGLAELSVIILFAVFLNLT